MKKDRLTMIICWSGILIFLLLVTGVLMKNGIINFPRQATAFGAAAETNTLELSETVEKPTSAYTDVYLEEGAECELLIPKSVRADGFYETISVEFTGVSFTKQRGNFDLVGDWDEIKDPEGTILNGFSYAVVMVKMINNSTETQNFSLNAFTLKPGGAMRTELRSFMSGKDRMNKDYFVVDLQAKKEYSFELAYIIPDEALNEKEYLLRATLSGANVNAPIIRKDGEIE